MYFQHLPSQTYRSRFEFLASGRLVVVVYFYVTSYRVALAYFYAFHFLIYCFW